MKKILAILAVVAFVAAPALAEFTGVGDTFSWGGKTDFLAVAQVTLSAGINNAGFMVTTVSGSLPGWGTTSFKTFCVEGGEFFSPSSTYYVSIDRAAYSGANPEVGYAGDNVSAATEWIYDQYIHNGQTGTIDGTPYALTVIRDAIWKLEGETISVAPGSSLETLYNAALGAGGIGDADGNVWALNLWTIGTDGKALDVQSQLIAVPVPGAALLGVIGVGIVGWVKRRLA